MEVLEEDRSRSQSAPSSKRPRICNVSRESFTVAWVCAITIELVAALRVLDEEYGNLLGSGSNIYTCGRIAEHNVVIVHLARYGNNSAADTAAQLNAEFPSITIRLMVGIGGGIPSEESDIRLGDIVVSRPKGAYPGVAQYDMLKSHADGATEYIGSLAPPPDLLLKASLTVEANHSLGRSSLLGHISAAAKRPESSDDLFEVSYNHAGGPTCVGCNRGRIHDRAARSDYEPCVHYGLIVSGNRVIKDSTTRDRIKRDFKDALCLEMEAAGLMNTFRCLVIRGICDYADSHKNKEWQPYAAATAAAYAKELLMAIPFQGVPSSQPQAPLSSTKTSPEDMRKALRSLMFPDMDFRKNDIGEECHGTCQWFSKHEKYGAWLKEETGLLWVKGKPGAGKSTIMNYALREGIPTFNRNSDITASFFFHARAGSNSLQTKALGLYQSMLYQTLSKVPQLLPRFASRFQHVIATEEQSADGWTKRENELRNFFKECIVGASKERAIYLFIDALDESDEKVARDIVKLFSRLVLDSRDVSGVLHICFSCRHYPNFDPPNSLIIEVEAENEDDIVTYIWNELQDRPEALQLEDKILEKSRGVFQWTALVVPMIVKLYEDGDYTAMRDHLDGAPEGLDALYENILHKLLSTDNNTLRVWLLKCICFSLRPLSTDDARWIMVLTPDSRYTTLDACKQDPNFCATDVQVHKRVKSLTWGLAEFVQSKSTIWKSLRTDGDMQVQLIHQSLQDYLTQDRFRRQAALFSVTNQRLLMSKMCLKYLTLRGVIFTDKDRWGVANSEFTNHASSWYKYAIRAQERDGSHLGALLDIERLVPRLGPMLRNHCSFCSPGFSDYSDNCSIFLHIVAGRGLHSLLEPLLTYENVNPNLKDTRGCTPLATILKGGIQIDYKDKEVFFLDREDNLCVCTYIDPVYDELEGELYDEPEDEPEGELYDEPEDEPEDLEMACSPKSTLRTLKVLLGNQTVDRNPRDHYGLTPLSFAVLRDIPAAVHLLLTDRKLDPDLRDNGGRTPFLLAAKYAGMNIFEQFLDVRGIDLHLRDAHRRTAMHWASQSAKNPEQKMRLLLTRGFDANALDDQSRTPLSRAAEIGCVSAIAYLLNEAGVDVNVKDLTGRTPLSWAASSGHLNAVRELLQNKAVDPSIQDNSGQTALLRAIESWGLSYSSSEQHGDRVKLAAELVNRTNIDLNQPNKFGQTLLSIAVKGLRSNCLEDFIDMLEAANTSTEFRDQDGRTTLSWAAQRSSERNVRWLLKRDGVHADSLDNFGHSPLWYAWHRQYWDGRFPFVCWREYEDHEESERIAAAIEQRISDELTGSWESELNKNSKVSKDSEDSGNSEDGEDSGDSGDSGDT